MSNVEPALIKLCSKTAVKKMSLSNFSTRPAIRFQNHETVNMKSTRLHKKPLLKVSLRY
jgi:hypothetical protein